MRFAFVIAAAAVAAFSFAGPLAALTDDEAEEIFLQHHRAIAAAESCYGIEFSQSQQLAMAQAINVAVENRIGTRRLRLVVEAEEEVRAMLPSQSCRGDRIVRLLEFFESDLRPVLADAEG